MWDAARIWKSLDETWQVIAPYFKRSSHPLGQPENVTIQKVPPERVDPMLFMGPDNVEKVQKHLVWMHQEIQKIAADGEIDKALRWLGFLQGAAWAMGMANMEAFKASNRELPTLSEYKVDDLVQCLGEAQTIFRVGKISAGGVRESTGSAFLLNLDGTSHGWEDFKQLRHTHGEWAEIAALRARAAEYRRMADTKWDRGRKEGAKQLHDEAHQLESQAALLEQKLDES